MFIVYLLLSLLLNEVACIKFPDQLQRCHLSDTEFSSCLDKALENALQILGQAAIPSSNLPTVDPLEITEITLGEGNNAVRLIQKYQDVKLIGWSVAKIKDSRLDLNEKTLSFKAFVKKISQLAKYEIDGKILVLPVYGKGNSTLELDDVDVDHIIQFREEIRKGRKYFKVVSYTLKLSPKNVHFAFENLFNGDEALAQPVLKVLSENSLEIYKDVGSGIEAAFGEVLRQIAAAFFNNIPINEIFLP